MRGHTGRVTSGSYKQYGVKRERVNTSLDAWLI